MTAPRQVRRLTPLFVLLALSACLTPATAAARQKHAAADANPARRLIHVAVTDERGEFVAALKPEDFTVLVNNRPARVVSASDSDVAASVDILLDTSGSMEGGRRRGLGAAARLREGVLRFLHDSHATTDFSLIAFNRSPQLLLERAVDSKVILAALDRYAAAEARGATVLYDALYLSLNRAAAGRHAKRALLLVTDGHDTASRYTRRDVERALAGSDVLVYAVLVQSPGGALTEDARLLLKRLSDISGGSLFYAVDENSLAAAMRQAAAALRSHYALTVELPSAAGSREWHRLKVSVKERRDEAGRRRRLKVRAREGFYAGPAEAARPGGDQGRGRRSRAAPQRASSGSRPQRAPAANLP
ncbi:MAG TPA: VWA domain-containing protein [Pyrinomonadaceae bacterium]|nr:VWA domain-containing protein [Pyrinomonadaceae bacterium]